MDIWFCIRNEGRHEGRKGGKEGKKTEGIEKLWSRKVTLKGAISILMGHFSDDNRIIPLNYGKKLSANLEFNNRWK